MQKIKRKYNIIKSNRINKDENKTSDFLINYSV